MKITLQQAAEKLRLATRERRRAEEMLSEHRGNGALLDAEKARTLNAELNARQAFAAALEEFLSSEDG